MSLCDSQSNLLVGEAQNPDQLLVEVDLPVPGHRAEPGLWIPGDFQLPHDPKEERCPEPFRQFKPYRNAACRDRTNQGMFHGTVLFYEGSKVSACISSIPEHCPPVPECRIFNEVNHDFQPVVLPDLL